MKKMTHFYSLLLVFLFFIITDSAYARKEVAHGVSIDSPLEAKIEMADLTAIITLKNISKDSLFIDKSIFGDSLYRRIFTVTTFKKEKRDQLTFYNQSDYSTIKHDYVTLLPNEEIQTITNLEQYFNFNEQEYDTLIIHYFADGSMLNESFENILEKDEYADMTQVTYLVRSKSIKLDYNSDILPYLSNNFEYKKKHIPRPRQTAEKKTDPIFERIMTKLKKFLM